MLENHLRWLLNDFLSEEVSEKWFLDETIVTSEQRSRAKHALKVEIKRNRKRYPAYKHWIGLNLTAIFEIISKITGPRTRKKGLKEKLDEIFIRSGAFIGYEDMRNAIQILTYIRCAPRNTGMYVQPKHAKRIMSDQIFFWKYSIVYLRISMARDMKKF